MSISRNSINWVVIFMAVSLPSAARGGDKSRATGKESEVATRLGGELERALTGHKMTSARLGAKVVDLGTGKTLYEKDADVPLMPASNLKMVVMAAAIEQLGKDFSFATVLALRGRDLVVIGGGDPTIGDERLADVRRESITEVFREWADRLKAAGVKHIPGNLVVDDSIFDQQFVHPNWPSTQFQNWYEAPVGGLNFNGNCTGVRVSPTKPGQPARLELIPGNTLLGFDNKTRTDSKHSAVVKRVRDSDTLQVSGQVSKPMELGPVTVRDPGLYFGYVLKTVLAGKGISLAGKVVREKVRLPGGKLPGRCHPVAVHRTPVADALSRAGKQSLGMMAEALIKQLGAKRSGMGTWDAGRAAVGDFLQKAGAAKGQFVIDDGSGLSRENRLSASAAVAVLKRMHGAGADVFDLFRRSLACAGTDGTLEKRLRFANTRGRVFAKTGYINGVRTLAGYVHTTSDRWLAFAFFYNTQSKGTAPLKQAQDQACRLLADWPAVKAPAK